MSKLFKRVPSFDLALAFTCFTSRHSNNNIITPNHNFLALVPYQVSVVKSWFVFKIPGAEDLKQTSLMCRAPKTVCLGIYDYLAKCP